MMYNRIDEQVVPTRRLGRHKNHDPRSLSYAIKSSASTAKTTTRKRLIPVLDQGDTGSCTGNAETGALGSEGTYETINAVMVGKGYAWNESFARDTLYHLATVLDPYDGTYPPTDTGSDGVSVSKAAQQLGLISGYVHALSVDAMTTGLQSTSGIMGINWYDSFDGVGANGVLTLPAGAKVRGGHEIHLLNVDLEHQWFELVNSWGTSWGVQGHFFMPFTIATRLLKEDGDATFPVVPTSPPPTPTPPSPPVPTNVDLALVAALNPWERTIVSRITKAGKAKTAYDAWKVAKGL